MNEICKVIGAIFCTVGGFSILFCILGFLVELLLETWADVYKKMCVAHKLSLSDVVDYGLCKEEFDEWIATHEPQAFKNRKR